jgi:hypothetical protein
LKLSNKEQNEETEDEQEEATERAHFFIWRRKIRASYLSIMKHIQREKN